MNPTRVVMAATAKATRAHARAGTARSRARRRADGAGLVRVADSMEDAEGPADEALRRPLWDTAGRVYGTVRRRLPAPGRVSPRPPRPALTARTGVQMP